MIRGCVCDLCGPFYFVILIRILQFAMQWKCWIWSSILLALNNIKEVGAVVDRPKALGDIRGVTYIYGMFYRFGLIDMPDKVNGKMKRAGRQMWHSKDGWRLLLLNVSYRTNILLLPPYPSKTRPVKFQSKNRREKAVRTTNNLLHSGLVSAHPHKIHPDITPQSRKITDWGEYLGRADAPAEAPGPQAFRRLVNENIHHNSHKYIGKKEMGKTWK